MTTRREAVLSALHEALHAIPGGVTVERNASLPERIPPEGLLILRDGSPGEPEVTLSPLLYHYQHRAEVEVFVRCPREADAAFDDLCASIGLVLAADRTLGGLCDWTEAEAPEPSDLPVDGAVPIRAAILTIVLHYTSADPLG